MASSNQSWADMAKKNLCPTCKLPSNACSCIIESPVELEPIPPKDHTYVIITQPIACKWCNKMQCICEDIEESCL